MDLANVFSLDQFKNEKIFYTVTVSLVLPVCGFF